MEVELPTVTQTIAELLNVRADGHIPFQGQRTWPSFAVLTDQREKVHGYKSELRHANVKWTMV
jgi:hypothetical protein